MISLPREYDLSMGGYVVLSDERKRQIISLVDEKGSVTIDDLQGRFPVSKMTLWRDLKQLSAEGAVRRVHGGVVSLEIQDTTRAREISEPLFTDKEIVRFDQKRRIAQFAAETFIRDNDVVILEGGTTA